ncbi:MAG TPA: PAS domain S-box protein, partial [Gemmatimonadaceae bacterium]|nr:PAS domain S-box protein [Gemmatimonadaceae bacterium]
MSRRFAASMRGGVQERQQNRRRLAAQLAVSRVLAEASDLQEVAPKVFEIVGERLGWEVGAFWTVEEGGAGEALRLAGMWRCGGVPPGALERASEGLAFRRGRGLPGRVWERGEPVWVEDVGEDAEFVRGEAADEDGMRGAMAFPVVDGGLVGVFEFFRREVLPPDEDLMRTAALTGGQIGQFVERRRAEEALGKSEENYRVMVDQAVAGILKLDLSGNVVFANERFAEMLGCSVKETLRLTIADIVHEEDAARNAELFERLRTEGRAFEIEKRLVRKDGSLVWVYNHVAPIFGEDGRPVQAAVVSVNINERRRAEALLDVQKRALEMVAGGDPLPDVLKYLAGVVEGPLVDSRSAASILLLDEGGRLYNGASPSLPQEYVEAIEGLEADENVGTCAAAAATGETVVTPDIDADPNWQDLKHLPLELGLQSAWSMPISNADGRVLGTFGTYFREKREPTEFERQTVEILAGTAALAVEHGRAEKAVRESEERFRALVGRGADMITVSNRDGRIVYASPTTERVSGYTPEEFAALDPFDNIYPEDRPRCEEAFRRLVDEPGLSLDLQHRVRHKSGGWRWVEGTFTSLFDEPAIGGLVANVRDVTLRKRAEEALLESEERYRTLFESIDEGFCVIEMIFDEDGEPADYRFLETNPSFERHTGLREAEGKRMLDLAPDHEAHWFEIYGQVATTGEPVRFERRSEALGGRWFDVYAFRLGGRESRRVALIFSDVTGRKREEGERERLRREAEEERARLEAILRQMPGGIFIAERSGRITLANDGAERIYRKSIGSVEECGEHSLSYPDGAKIPWRDHPLVRALEGESVTDMEHYVLRDDGTRAVVRVNAAPVCDEEGRVVAAIKALDDVTAQKEAEAALGETEERLRTVVEGTPVVLFSLDRVGVYKLAEGRGLEAL